MSYCLPETKREKCLELPSVKGPSYVSSGRSEGQEGGKHVWWGVVTHLGRGARG